MLLRIQSSYFVAGIEVGAGRAAPIVRYMVGWDIQRIQAYCARKGWRVEMVDAGGVETSGSADQQKRLGEFNGATQA